MPRWFHVLQAVRPEGLPGGEADIGKLRVPQNVGDFRKDAVRVHVHRGGPPGTDVDLAPGGLGERPRQRREQYRAPPPRLPPSKTLCDPPWWTPLRVCSRPAAAGCGRRGACSCSSLRMKVYSLECAPERAAAAPGANLTSCNVLGFRWRGHTVFSSVAGCRADADGAAAAIGPLSTSIGPAPVESGGRECISWWWKTIRPWPGTSCTASPRPATMSTTSATAATCCGPPPTTPSTCSWWTACCRAWTA